MRPAPERRQWLTMPRVDLRRHQLTQLNGLLGRILPENVLYHAKFGGQTPQLRSWQDLRDLPLTTKDDLVHGCLASNSIAPGPENAELSAAVPRYLRPAGPLDFAANRTFPIDDYVRFHRTSGTHGRPMVVLDRAEDWGWWLGAWEFVLDAAGVTAADRVFMAFSFGPFVGFWSAFDAVTARRCLVIPGGGLSTTARLDLIAGSGATVLFSTPSYALHLAETAATAGIDLKSFAIKTIIVAGEPGGSIPAVREKIESAWQAKLYDHAGATEIGPWGFSTPSGQDLLVNEADFLPEFLVSDSDAFAGDGELSELVLTTSGRDGSPVIRYRTGDLVRPRWDGGEENGVGFVRLEGGVLGRADDMLIVRGVNIFPSSIEEILRRHDEIDEFRIIAIRHGAMDDLHVEVEDRLNAPERIATALAVGLGLRVEVTCVPAGSLPRFELKARRFVDRRHE